MAQTTKHHADQVQATVARGSAATSAVVASWRRSSNFHRLDPAECKGKLAAYLPRAIAAWLVERSSGERVIWTFPSAAVAKLAKGKHPIAPKAMASLMTISRFG